MSPLYIGFWISLIGLRSQNLWRFPWRGLHDTISIIELISGLIVFSKHASSERYTHRWHYRWRNSWARLPLKPLVGPPMTPPVAHIADPNLKVVFIVIEANLSRFWTPLSNVDSYFSSNLKGMIYLKDSKILEHYFINSWSPTLRGSKVPPIDFTRKFMNNSCESCCPIFFMNKSFTSTKSLLCLYQLHRHVRRRKKLSHQARWGECSYRCEDYLLRLTPHL